MATPSFLSSSLRPSLGNTSSYICKTCRRTEATYRRTRKALRVKPDPSFAPTEIETTDHIIFNPPSSAPNVYHTPAKFLPKSDPRRAALQVASQLSSTPTSAPPQGILATLAAQRAPDARRLVPVRREVEQKYHLSPSQIEEIRASRKQDPRQWTRRRLAEKYDCSQFFISLVCSAPEVAREVAAKDEGERAKWGRKRMEAREGRQERKKLWGKDA